MTALSNIARLAKARVLFLLAFAICLASCRSGPRAFDARGVIHEIKPGGQTAIIRHEAIPNYMDAMTMPFQARDANALHGVLPGDEIQFRLLVTDNDSWIDRVKKTGRTQPVPQPKPPAATNATIGSRHPLMDYAFTNHLGEPATLASFRGQALAITFFFTRCPIPDYCPRLSKNFEEACAALKAIPNALTNWHLLSVTIDPEFDTPAVLRAYAKRYAHDPRHWSFLTGPKDKITELARQSGMTMEPGEGLLNHNFRTLIIGTNGDLKMSFPISGDISDGIVSELVKTLGPGSESTK